MLSHGDPFFATGPSSRLASAQGSILVMRKERGSHGPPNLTNKSEEQPAESLRSRLFAGVVLALIGAAVRVWG